MSSEFENKEKRFEIAKMILEAYKTSNFEILYDLFANDIKWCSQWVVPDREGKDVVTKYYDKKKEALINSNSVIEGDVIEMIQPFTGDIGVFFKQKLDDDTNGIVVTFKLNDLGMINMICLNAPYLYKFQKYIN